MCFVGISKEYTLTNVEAMATKIAHARLFDDSLGKLNLNIQEVGGSILSISQFTLYANTKKGHRPSFDLAANAMDAKLLYQLFNDRLAIFCKVETGIFQVHMNIDSSNDGPVSIMYEN